MRYWQPPGHGSILHVHWQMNEQRCGTQIPWNISPKEERTVSPNEVDEPRACYREWSKAGKQVSYIHACIWDVGRWRWWTHLQGSGGDADIEKRCLIKPQCFHLFGGRFCTLLACTAVEIKHRHILALKICRWNNDNDCLVEQGVVTHSQWNIEDRKQSGRRPACRAEVLQPWEFLQEACCPAGSGHPLPCYHGVEAQVCVLIFMKSEGLGDPWGFPGERF